MSDPPNMIDPRERLTRGITAERLKMEGKRAVRPSILFVIGVLVAVAVVAYFLTNISETFGRKAYQVRFEVPTSFGVFEGFDQVRFRGVPAGNITKIERRGTQLVLLTNIRREYGPIYRDARSEIRPITPLNDVYLDVVDPGTKAAGEADPKVPLGEAQTSANVTVPEVLNTFQPDVRRGFHQLLDGLGNGMDDGGVRLRQAFVAIVPFLQEAGDLTRQVALRQHATRRLIHNTAVLTRELARRDADLKRLVSTGSVTLGALEASSTDFDATLRELGPTFTELEATLLSVRAVVDDVDRGVRAMYPVAESLPQSLAAVRALNRTLRPAIRRLERPVHVLVPLVTAVRDTADMALQISETTRPQVPTFNRLMQRLVDCEQPVINFFQWNMSLSKFGDRNGSIPRGNLAFGVPAAGAPGEALRDPEPACTRDFPARGVPTEEHLH